MFFLTAHSTEFAVAFWLPCAVVWLCSPPPCPFLLKPLYFYVFYIKVIWGQMYNAYLSEIGLFVTYAEYDGIIKYAELWWHIISLNFICHQMMGFLWLSNISTYVCLWVYLYLSVWLCVYVCLWIYVCTHICGGVCVCISVWSVTVLAANHFMGTQANFSSRSLQMAVVDASVEDHLLNQYLYSLSYAGVSSFANQACFCLTHRASSGLHRQHVSPAHGPFPLMKSLVLT